ncbi:hypothetical protein Glove_41g146 [Diversispora epigaea]|uniref:Uncharacterized protein n=1 Tax=Diversispora epigaea TaxID=1348612 RepID=A0A397JJP6_9GLOM|nr:hypothetical protein Glove_41g146 [Diversispora epigaea]
MLLNSIDIKCDFLHQSNFQYIPKIILINKQVEITLIQDVQRNAFDPQDVALTYGLIAKVLKF